MKQETIDKIKQHYEHAKEKHPYFCNRLSYHTKYGATDELQSARRDLEFNIENESVSFKDVINCEIAEAIKEIVDGKPERAVEELYDCIAVCLRGIDVLEGRLALGDPAKKGGK